MNTSLPENVDTPQNATLDTLTVDFGCIQPNHDTTLAIRERYDQFGCVVAKRFFPEKEFKALHKDITYLIRRRRAAAGLTERPALLSDRFDAGFTELNRVDRRHGAVIYDAVQRLAPKSWLAANEQIITVSRMLMQTNTLMCSDPNDLRVDQPFEDRFLFKWHQDFPYTPNSPDAVVFWIPLHDVSTENGCLRIAVASHRRVQPVKIRKGRSNTRNIELDDPTVVSRFQQLDVPLALGDVLIFSNLLLHTSQANRSEDTRWTIQIRYANFENQESVDRDWPGNVARGYRFERLYPEYVTHIDP